MTSLSRLLLPVLAAAGGLALALPASAALIEPAAYTAAQHRPTKDWREFDHGWSDPSVVTPGAAWQQGEIAPAQVWSPRYLITDIAHYGLARPPLGDAWFRFGREALLINQKTGEVMQVVQHLTA